MTDCFRSSICERMRLAWFGVMNWFSTSRSASDRWLGSDDCLSDSRQKSTSVLVARPRSTTTFPTSVSRLALMPIALESLLAGMSCRILGAALSVVILWCKEVLAPRVGYHKVRLAYDPVK